MRRSTRQRMETYTVAMKPEMMDEVKKFAKQDGIAVRLFIREAIEIMLQAHRSAERTKKLAAALKDSA